MPTECHVCEGIGLVECDTEGWFDMVECWRCKGTGVIQP